jgi:hypothetical protein
MKPDVSTELGLAIAAIRIAAIPNWLGALSFLSYSATAFRCSNGDANDKVVRIEATKKNDQVVCPGCGSLFYAREGKFA